MAEKTVIIKVTDQGLKEALADAKELKKVLKEIAALKVSIDKEGQGKQRTDTKKGKDKDPQRSTVGGMGQAQAGLTAATAAGVGGAQSSIIKEMDERADSISRVSKEVIKSAANEQVIQETTNEQRKVALEQQEQERLGQQRLNLGKKDSTEALDANSKAANKNYNANRGVAGAVGKAGKEFSNMASGMGGFIHVYATLAAHAFALSAAFGVLTRAMDTSIMVKGLEEMGASSGINLKGMAKDFREVTGSAVSTAEAMRTVAFASSAGMSGEAISQLGQVARGAALALGRDVGDAVDRLTRGVVKLEPEILDELGLIVRVDSASRAYAKTIGKTKDELSAYERQQAFANATIEQGMLKYGALNKTLENSPYAVIASQIADATQAVLDFVNSSPLGTFITWLSKSSTAIVAVLLLGVNYLSKHLVTPVAEASAKFKESLEIRKTALREEHAVYLKLQTEKASIEEAARSRDVGSKHKSALKSLESRGIGFGSDAKSQTDIAVADKQIKARLKAINIEIAKSGQWTGVVRGKEVTITKAAYAQMERDSAELSKALKAHRSSEDVKTKTSRHNEVVWAERSYIAIGKAQAVAKAKMKAFWADRTAPNAYFASIINFSRVAAYQVRQNMAWMKAGTVTAFEGMKKAIGKLFKWFMIATMAWALLEDQIKSFLTWTGLAAEKNEALTKSMEAMSSHAENLTDVVKKYNNNLRDSVKDSEFFINQHKAMGNALSAFKPIALDMSESLEGYQLGSSSFSNLEEEVEGVQKAIAAYKKFGDTKLNSSIDKALRKQGLSTKNLVQQLKEGADAPKRFQEALKSLIPVLDEIARKEKTAQVALEGLDTKMKGFSDSWKSFKDSFKEGGTPFAKMLKDIRGIQLNIELTKILDPEGVQALVNKYKGILGEALNLDVEGSSSALTGVEDKVKTLKLALNKSKKELDSYLKATKDNWYDSTKETTKKIKLAATESSARKALTAAVKEKRSLVKQFSQYIESELNKFLSMIEALETRSVHRKRVQEEAKAQETYFKGLRKTEKALIKEIELTQELKELKSQELQDSLTLLSLPTARKQAEYTKAIGEEAAIRAKIAKQTAEGIHTSASLHKKELGIAAKKVKELGHELKLQVKIESNLKRQVALAKEEERTHNGAYTKRIGLINIQATEYQRLVAIQRESISLNKSIVELDDDRTLTQKLDKSQKTQTLELQRFQLSSQEKYLEAKKTEAVEQARIVKLTEDARLKALDIINAKDQVTEQQHRDLNLLKEKLAVAKDSKSLLEKETELLVLKLEAEREVLNLKQKAQRVESTGAGEVFSKVQDFKSDALGGDLGNDLLAVHMGGVYSEEEVKLTKIKELETKITEELRKHTEEYEKQLYIQENGTAEGFSPSRAPNEAIRNTTTELNTWLVDQNQAMLETMSMHWEGYAEKVGSLQLSSVGKAIVQVNALANWEETTAKKTVGIKAKWDKQYMVIAKANTKDEKAAVKKSQKYKDAAAKHDYNVSKAFESKKLDAYANTFGSLGSMMEADSKAQQAFFAIEKAIHLAQMAMSVAKMLGYGEVATEAVASSTTVIGAEVAKMGPKGANAILTQGEGDAYSAPARMAAMAALVAVVMSAGGGGSTSTAAPRTERVSSSATLETPEEKADSLKTALANIEEIEIKAFEQGWDVLYALRSIDDSMTKLSTDIIKGMQALGGVGTFSIGDMETVFGDWFGTTVKPAFLGLFGGKSTTTELMGAGVRIVAQKLADVIDLDAGSWANLELKVWEKIKSTTTKSGFLGFGGGTSSSTTTKWKDFDTDAENSLAKTLFDIGDAVLSLGEDLGFARSALIDNLKDFEIAVQDIDLMGLSPEEQASAVQSALSAIANDITLKMIPAVEQWRYAGEEYLEALSRVYRDMLGFKQAFDRIGLTTGDFLSATGIEDILDWQQNVLKSKKGGFGDIKGFLTSLENFGKALYSEGELAKFALDSAKNRVGTGLSELGLAAGTSVDDFRTWYESKLGTGFFDDPDKLATMIRLGEAFGDMTNSADDLKDAFGDIIGLIDEMKYGDLSSLTAADKYSHFKTEAEKLAADAMAGDVKAGEKLADSMSTFIELSKDMFGGVGTFMKDRDWALKQLEDFRALMGFAMGGVVSGGFRAFAAGGTVNQPTLGLVGEGRFNEAIVPLPDGKSIPVVMNDSPMVSELRTFREQQAQLMQSAVTISSQEREEMKETMEDLKAEIIELRGSTESFGSSVERVATSVEYSRA